MQFIDISDYIRSFKSVRKCNCGRPWCDFSYPGVYDAGVSLTREQLIEHLADLKEMQGDRFKQELESTVLFLETLLKDN